MDSSAEKIEAGIKYALIDSSGKPDVDVFPKFIYNNSAKRQKVLVALMDELKKCDEFMISVAFLTDSGIKPLFNIFEELNRRNVSGKILTTNYLNFSEPKAMSDLLKFPNIQLKMYWTQPNEGFHTKGYIFKHGDTYRIIVGSANLTGSALAKNEEWNTLIMSTQNGQYTCDILARFNSLWDSENSLEYDAFIDKYKVAYSISKKYRNTALAESDVVELSAMKFTPNTMQRDFIANLGKIMASGENRALLISATGTGKTYASAFAAQSKEYKRVLFLVHREQIAKQAMKSFEKIFGKTRSYGLVSGNSSDYEKDFVFSTIQTMQKEENLRKYSKDAFELIIIDEAHRIGNNKYQNVLEYFQPKFLLGMTASPERTDNYDVYSVFNHNIAYEIRLEDALEADLLCPFHYFGITDFVADGVKYNENDLSEFKYLVSEKRVEYIIEKIKFYGYSGSRVKGLIFCSRKDEARELSILFNNNGYSTVSLSGEDSQETREEVINRLTSDDIKKEDQLDYIFTVDIFNEGVDIPEINQVVMLRPTQSAIIFVQQLGRGLRKFQDKEYVVIIDFIGNYQGNNFFIPMALSGDRTYNKDNIRRFVSAGNRMIPGISTVHFDEISKKRIYASIDAARFGKSELIKENYLKLKNKLGRIPKMADFEEFGEMDVMYIVNSNISYNKKYIRSYYDFLVKYEKEYITRLTELENEFIDFISQKFMEGKRIHELIILEYLLDNDNDVIANTEKILLENYGIDFKPCTREHLVNVMTNIWFQVGNDGGKYKDCVFIDKDENGQDYHISNIYKNMLMNTNFRNIVEEIISFGKARYSKKYSERYMGSDLVLYQKYEYDDVFRILQWSKNEVSLNIGGYKYDSYSNTCPVFINYEKADDIAESINYEDKFLSNKRLISFSKNKRTLKSPDVVNFINAQNNLTSVEIFVRKNKDDKVAKSFYYLGRMNLLDAKQTTKLNKEKSNAETNIVEFEWLLDTPVREDIYEYITDND